MKKEISVIIPCYNVEKYIKKCVESLEKQLSKFQHEIILIDDCSTDNTLKIIERINNPNVIVIKNASNIGAGATRNKGVAVAKYDLISFVDADDFLDDNFYDIMYNTMNKDKSDVVVCDITTIDEETKEKKKYKSCEFVTSKYNLINTGFAASPCNKLIKKNYLLKYQFPEGIMNEDVATIIAIIANCRKLSYTEETNYYYVQHSESVQHSPLTEKRLDIIKSVSILDERINKNRSYKHFIRAVIFNQIIAFLLYVPPKEKNIFKRAMFISKFGRKTKRFELRKNNIYNNFINNKNRKSRFYYKVYMKLACNGLGFLASLWVLVYDIYKLIFKSKKVIKENITIEDIKKAAIKNQSYNSSNTLTVAIPNYNYAKFLYERLYSILYQKYKINEIIILDDCSTDNSVQLIKRIEKELNDIIDIKSIYNKKNSGSVFKQWRKALETSKSEYLWIAEADDYCDKKMISSLMKIMSKDSDIKLAYVDTAFIDKEGKIILKTIKPEIDIMKTKHWDETFINDGFSEIKDYAYLNCTIANVSSVIFKKDDYSWIFDEIGEYKQVGDYLFYLSVMSTGKIAFVNKPLNYYRVHGDNVTSTTKKQLHFDELKKVHNKLDKKYKFNKKQKKEIEKRYKFLKRVWGVK